MNKENNFSNNSQEFNSNATEVLFVTANVGSLFEDPQRLLKPWLHEFLCKVAEKKPEFIALHLQEVGGKTYEKSMDYVQEFIVSLCKADNVCEYPCIRIYMDEDYKSAEHFTALGNLYFIHKNLSQVKLWNFDTHSWEAAIDKTIYTGNIEEVATKEKSKFPQYFFPECKWSRKGFMRTRWQINGSILDLVNIHLFHDASNLAACEEFPSVYCKTRRRALVHTLERFHLDNQNGLVPFFIFGDFNFRCDVEGVIKELTPNLTVHRVQTTKGDSTKVHYRNSDGNDVLTIGKKEFSHIDHQIKFKEPWLKRFDRELEPLNGILFEYPIAFAATYPFEEDPQLPTDYMSTRCPSWCDRILMSLPAKEIIAESTEVAVNDDGRSTCSSTYGIIGENVCMGDHKPIYLHAKLKTDQGIYNGCSCYMRRTSNDQQRAKTELVLDYVTPVCHDVFCPYESPVYLEILHECIKAKRLKGRPKRKTPERPPQVAVCHSIHKSLQSSQRGSAGGGDGGGDMTPTAQHPRVSINLFDSDNRNISLCSANSADGISCPDCSSDGSQSVQQSFGSGQKCALVSQRVVLGNELIVNRIDTQYLNTYTELSHHIHEPYTPESAESHSPCPEFNSTTTDSSDDRSPCERNVEGGGSVVIEITAHHAGSQAACERTRMLGGSESSAVKSRRGIVSPGQLKSRLEGLQRSSQHSLNDATDTCSGVDANVDDRLCPKKIIYKKHKSKCLPGCCKIS